MRSEELERDFFVAAVRFQDTDPEKANRFIERVRTRLRKGATEYGDLAFRDKPITELISEAKEEGEDVPAWLALASQVLEDDEALSETDREHMMRYLIAASAAALEVWSILDQAAEFYEDQTRQHLTASV